MKDIPRDDESVSVEARRVCGRQLFELGILEEVACGVGNRFQFSRHYNYPHFSIGHG